LRLRSVPATALLLFSACASQQKPPASAPAPSTQTSSQARAAEDKADEPKRLEAAKAALAGASSSFAEALAAIAPKNVNAAAFDRVREEKLKLEKTLAESVALESKDEAYGKQASDARSELAKGKAAIDARWLEVGLVLSRSRLEESSKQINVALKGTARRDAKDEDFAKAQSLIEHMSAQLGESTALEAKDAKYAQYAAVKKQQLAAYQKQLEASRQRAVVQAQQDRVMKAKAEAEGKISQLKNAVEESAFETAKSAVDALEEALNAGKPIEEKDAGYLKVANNVRASVERDKAAITAARARQKIEVHKRSVEAARKVAAEAMKALAASPEGVDAAENALLEIVHLLESGKEFAAGDKAYAQYAANVTKEVLAHRAIIDRLRQQAASAAHKKQVEEAAAEAASRIAALKEKTDKEAIAAAEQAIGALEKVLKDGEPIAAKDRAHAAYLAVLTKKLADQRAQVVKATAASKIAAHQQLLHAEKEKVDEKLAGLVGKVEHELYQGAEDAISGLEKALSAADEAAAGDPKFAQELRGLRGQIPSMRMQIKRRWVEAANGAVVERLKALEGEADEKAFAAANQAVRFLSNTIESAKSFDSKDKSYLGFVASMEKLVPAHQAKIEQRRIGQKIEKHRTVVEAAHSNTMERLKALEGEPAVGAFESAEASVAELKSALESVDAEAANDRAYHGYLEGLKKKADAYTAKIARRRAEVAVAAHKKALVAATAAIAEKWSALAASPSDAAFSAAEESVAALEKVIADGADAGEKDPKYAKELAAQKARIPGYRSNIEKRRTETSVSQHRAKTDAAAKAAADALAGSDLSEAGRALEALEQALAEGEPLSAKDAKHAAFLAAIKKKLPQQQALFKKKQTEQKVAAHRTEVQAAKAKVAEKLRALEGKLENAPYQAADSAIADLGNVVAAGDPIAEEDPKYAKELRGIQDEIPAQKALVRRRYVEAAAAVVADKMKALEGDPQGPAFSAAEDAVQAFAKAVETAKRFEGKDKSYLGFVAASEKQIAAQEAAIKKRRVSLVIAAHRAKIEAASASAAEKVKALEAEQPEFDAAEAAVLELENTFKSEDPVVTGDRGHQAFIAGERKKVAGYLAVIQRRRTEVSVATHTADLQKAEERVREQVGGLKGKLDSALYKAADDAIAELEKGLEANVPLGKKDSAFGKRLAAAKRAIPGYRATLKKSRLEAAGAIVAERMKALEGKPEEAQFAAAEAAVKDFVDVLGQKDGGKQGAAYRATIAKRRFDAEVSEVRAKIGAADKAVLEKLEALGQKREDAAFAAAEESVAQLDAALQEAKPFGEKNKAYEKELAAQRKRISGYKARIAKNRFELERDEHQVRLDAAEKAVTGLVKGFAKDPSAAEHADETIALLVKEIDAGAKFAKDDKKHAKKLAALRKDLPKQRAAIASARFELALKGHREAVEQAAAEVEKRIDALKEGSAPPAIEAAESSVKDLEAAIQSGQPLAKKSKPHAKWLSLYPKRIAQFRGAIGKRAVEGEVKAHRAELEAARGEVNEQLKGLQGQLEYGLYKSAEDVISKLKKVIDAGAPLGEKDDGYAKQLAAANAEVDADRVAVRRTWIEAAEAAVVEKLKPLEGRPDAAAFRATDAALKFLGNTIESGKGLSQNKAYLKFYAASEKRAKGYQATIERRRSETEFSGVRADLEQAAKEEAARMSALEGEPNDEAIDAAATSLSALEQALDANVPAAEKDRQHQKHVAALKKRLEKDRAKLDLVKGLQGSKVQRERLAAAESALSQKMAALKGSPDSAAVDAAGEAVSELESALADAKPVLEANKKSKKRVAEDQKRIAAARGAIKSKKSEVRFSEHRAQVEAALRAAKEKVAAIDREGEADPIAAADDAVKELVSVIDSGKDLAKQNKKYGVYLAAARKTSRSLQAAIKKKKPAGAAPESDDATAKVDASAPKVALAQAALKERIKALGPRPDKVALTDARAAIDGLESALEEAKADGKKSKTYLKRITLAKELLGKGKKKVARLEASAARSSDGGGESSKGDDPQDKLAEAWSAFAKQMKALRHGTPSAEDIENATKAADEVVQVLEQGDQSRAAKSAKYKKYAAAIRKKLKKERGKLKKLRGQVQYSHR
jgi:hypothetical protein